MEPETDYKDPFDIYVSVPVGIAIAVVFWVVVIGIAYLWAVHNA